jgi:hypothetical protein
MVSEKVMNTKRVQDRVKSPDHKPQTQLLNIPQSEGIGAAEMEKITGVSEP